MIMGRQVSAINPSFSAPFKPYLAALGHLGYQQEAATVLQRLLAIEPGFTVELFSQVTPIARDVDRSHYVMGLRLAGCP